MQVNYKGQTIIRFSGDGRCGCSIAAWRIRSGCLGIVLALLRAAPCDAAHPLITEDAGTQGGATASWS